MEKHCTSVYFMVKKTRKDKNGLSPIVAYISVNAVRVSYYTGKKIKVSDWDDEKQLVRGRSEEAKQLNEYLYQLRNKIFQKEIELMEKGFMITANLLKEAVNDHVDAINQKTLLDVFKDFQAMRKLLVGKKISQDTYEANELTGRYIKEFMGAKYHREDIYLHEVKLGFIQCFHTYLLTEKNNCQNSCSKHLKFLKQLINIAVANGYIKFNPLNIYKVEREHVDIDYLDDVELRKIINFTTPIKRFERTRDAFLFGCFTGLAYIDIKTLRKEHFETDDEGRIWIKKKRIKTGVLSRIPLLPMAKLLLDKYYDPNSDIVMPIQDSTDVNENLKDIATLCGINKRVTFHVGRHSFASLVTLEDGVPIETISKMLGHNNIQTTQIYARVTPKKLFEDMDNFIEANKDFKFVL